MRKKLFGSVILGGITCAALALSACSGNGGSGTSNSSGSQKPSPITGEHVLNGFDSVEDLYNIKWINISYASVGSMDINTESDYIKGGNGSLKIDVASTKNDPEFNFKTQNCALPEMDVTDLKNISVWIYNANESDVEASLNVLRSDDTHLLSQSFTLTAGEWTECVMDVNAVVTKYAYSSISGFSFAFEAVSPSTFYVDEFSAEFGKVFTQEDEGYVTKIEGIISDISGIPTKITLDDESTLSTIYDKYNSLPDIYKSAVTNYSSLSQAMSDVLYAKVKGETSTTERVAFYFDKFYGVTQLKNAETSKNTFGYSKEVKFGAEDGSTFVNHIGEIWNYTDISTSVSIGDYDYITLSLYTDCEELAIWFNSKSAGWQNRVNVKGGEWLTVQIPTAYCNATGVQLISTKSINGGEASPVDGKLYISSIKCCKLNESQAFANALAQDTPYSVENGSLSTAGGFATVTASNDEGVDVLLNKSQTSINVSQNAVLAFRAPKALSLALLDADKTEYATISCAEGWNTLTLTDSQYNSLAYIRIAALEGEEYKLGITYIVRKSDLQAAKLYLGRDYLTAVASATVGDLPSYISYLTIFNNSSLTELKSQFVKVSQELDAELYAEQVALYDEIVATIDSVREKTKTLIERAIDNASATNAAVNDLYLLNSVYEDYTSAKLCLALTTEYKAKAEAALAKVADLPLRLVDVTSAIDRAKFGISVKYYPWKADVTCAQNSEYGSVMRLHITKVEMGSIEFKYDNSVDLGDYDYVAFSIYTRNSKTLRFSTIGWGNVQATYTVLGGEWTQIIVPKSVYTSTGYMLISAWSSINVDDEILFGDFYAYNAKAVVREIDNLPEIADVTLSDEDKVFAVGSLYDNLSASSQRKVTNIETLENLQVKIVTMRIAALPDAESVTLVHSELIEKAKNAYDSLSATAKAKVSADDVTKLDACVEKATDNKFAMSSSSLSKTDFVPWGENYTVESYTDTTYGNGIKITRGNIGNIGLLIDTTVLSAAKLDDYQYVVFYVYNSYSEQLTVRKMAVDWSNAATIVTDCAVTASGTTMYYLRGDGWTQCYMSVNDFKNVASKYLCFYDKIPGGQYVVISDFYAVKTQPDFGSTDPDEGTPDVPDTIPKCSTVPNTHSRRRLLPRVAIITPVGITDIGAT